MRSSLFTPNNVLYIKSVLSLSFFWTAKTPTVESQLVFQAKCSSSGRLARPHTQVKVCIKETGMQTTASAVCNEQKFAYILQQLI